MNEKSPDFQWNLFPFRREVALANKRKLLLQCSKILFLEIMIIVVAYLILCGFNKYLNVEIQKYENKNSSRSVIEMSEGQLENEKTIISAQIQNLENLSDRRTTPVNMLAQLARIIPNGECLSKIELLKNAVTVEGKAQSIKEINNTLQLMQKNHLFIHPKIIEQKMQPSNLSTEIYFVLKFTIGNQ